MEKEKILGFDVCSYEQEQLLKNIFEDYKKNEQLFIVNINPEIVVTNYKNKEFKKTLNKQKYQIPDGSGIVWASKKNKGNIKQRITGIDLMLDICEESQKYGSRIFLYGSKPGIAKTAKKNLEEQFPKINIVGECDGYCDENEATQKIMIAKPDIVFVGLGSPKQENFIIKYKDELKNIKILMPVGGSFDVISKTKKRAPEWVRTHNLEWLYRLFQEPKRILRQIKLVKYILLILLNRKGEEDYEQN